MRRAIANIFELNHRCYRYRRIPAALGRQQVFLSEKVVRRLTLGSLPRQGGADQTLTHLTNHFWQHVNVRLLLCTIMPALTPTYGMLLRSH